MRSLAVGYPRANVPERQPEQQETHLTLTLNWFTNRDDQADWYRVGLPVESRTYEVVKPPATPQRFTWEDLRDLVTALVPLGQHEPPPAKTIPYEQWDWRKQWNPQIAPGGLINGDAVHTRLRLIEHVRTLYRKNDLTALLALGDVESLALPGESYQLAFTLELAQHIFVESGKLTAPALHGILADEGKYVPSEGDANWWMPSGRIFYSPGSNDTPEEELAHARTHFFLPHRFRDPFHTSQVRTETVVTYDDRYQLLVVRTQDAVDNTITALHDYRVLQPRLVTDPNGNRTEAAFDILGMVVATAVQGKAGQNLGDLLEDFDPDPPLTALQAFVADPRGQAASLLGKATTRIVYDLERYQRCDQPPFAATLARETHFYDSGGPQTKIQLSFSYSDGFGREVQKKMQAEAGDAPQRGPAVTLPSGDVRPGDLVRDANGDPIQAQTPQRWVGNGRTVFNNKGKPVKQYEPFFSATHLYEEEREMTDTGVSPILFYDPVERVVATLHPNHTWEKVVFDPWRQETWDVNDTVLVADPKIDADVRGFFRRLPDADYLPTWHQGRIGNLPTDPERQAAEKAAKHAATPTIAHADALGRTFLTIAHNKFERKNPDDTIEMVEEQYPTRIELDIEGNQRAVIDARNRVVMRYDYDMLGNRIHQASMEAGARWMLNDVAGKPIRVWDSRGHAFHTTYDPLRRPLRSFVTGAVPNNPHQELLIERLVYGEQHTENVLRNLRGVVYLYFDQAGVVTNEGYNFKGNLLHATRRLAREYKQAVDWSAVDAVLPADPIAKLDLPIPEATLASRLEAETFTSLTRYDALNRPTELTTPHTLAMRPNVIRPTYNEANLLERVEANLRGAQQNDQLVWTPFVTDIDYDAKGQRTQINYATRDGKLISTSYTYDRETFRLTHLFTRRGVDPATRQGVTFTDDCDNPQPPPPTIAAPENPPEGQPCGLQNLHYTYDPAGNIMHIRDDAQQTLYFRNKRVEPSADYTYDAVYRLIEATGREHLGQVGGSPIPHSYNDAPRVGLLHPGDGKAMGRYLERYVYDAVGNFQEMIHHGTDPANLGWTRTYAYRETSLLEPGKESNRLTSTTIGATTEAYSTNRDGYDAHGNMQRMPQLEIMQWDFNDQLHMTQRQKVNDEDTEGMQRQGERTWYVYDASGQRVRKVTELATGQFKDERIYLDGFEVYRRHGANPLVRETLHIMDDQQRIALVETRTQGNDGSPEQIIRYQFGNHLGSASLELDDVGQIISYEEYYPYGSTSYQAVHSQMETPKRYRYT